MCSIKVIGIPDDRLGEQVCACIKLKEGHTATEEDIKQFCKGKVSISNDDVIKNEHIVGARAGQEAKVEGQE